jgi:hypothetical protein
VLGWIVSGLAVVVLAGWFLSNVYRHNRDYQATKKFFEKVGAIIGRHKPHSD